MRLQSLIPSIPQDLVVALEACGIRTDIDLLFCGTSIAVLQKLPPGTVTLADLEKYTKLVAEKASAPGIRGDEWLAKELKDPRDGADLTCGVDELDALVGGFGSSLVFEVSGDRGSGKTALALQIVLRLLASRADVSILWMDTTGDFSVQRTADMAQHLHGEASETALERLEVSLVLNVESAQDVLEELRTLFSDNPASAPRPRCVVIDSVTPLLAPSLSAVTSHGHAMMTTFMQHLRFLARTYSITFLIINDTSSSLPYNPSSAFQSTNRKPALGPSFTFLTDCTLWLAKQERSSESADTEYTTHVAEVFRSRTTSSRTWCTFQIRQGLLYSAS